jgi:phosphotransferase system  glucose/maltose/N-acetylglucosamine-specific IIC component
MADFTCPPGFSKHIDLDANAEYCADAAGNRAPAIYPSSTASIVVMGGLAAAGIALAALLMAPKKKRKRGRR